MLQPRQSGAFPLGQFDGLDTDIPNIKGGEVVTFVSIPVTSTDKAAQDVFDGYTDYSSVQKRTVVTKTIGTRSRPLMLADDGIAGYGTLFGVVVGGCVGKQVIDGTPLGPHTATGSGKITCWEKPGLYAVSLDACDTDPATGLNPLNTSLDTGAPLYPMANGLLSPNPPGLSPDIIVGRFIEFESNGSLVTTPNRLVSGWNSPSGTAPGLRHFAFAVFYFNPPV